MIALLFSVTIIAACGQSAEEKAKAEVCSARSEISKEISKLQSLTLSTNTVNEAKTSFEAIGKQLTKIRDAQPKLSPARKEQVQAATNKFESQLATIASGVASSLPAAGLESALKGAQPKIKSALSALAADYQQALAPINCS